MSDEIREIEMRVEGPSGPERADAILRVVRQLDPAATVRVDPDTGIVHATTWRDTLEVVAALTAAGLDATATTM
jgi:hypothetical protein